MNPAATSRQKLLPFTSDPALRRRFMVLRDALPGNLRFGVLLEVLDQLAAETALDYVQPTLPDAHVVTAAVDEIVVRRIGDVSQDLACRARVNHVGRSSMEIGIRVEAASPEPHLASCYFTMVARVGHGADARSVALPPLDLADDLDRARDARAARRRATYRERAACAEEPPSREEYLALAALHRAQDAAGFAGALARDLVAETWERTYPEQENLSKVIFGGYIMRRAYELSALCAERVATHRPLLAAVNRINFFHPVQIGDKLHLSSRVAYAERSFVCVETEIERISRDRTVRALSNSCLFTFVNVGPDLAPREVPAIHPSTYAEDARYLSARRNLQGLAARVRGGWVAARLEAAVAAGGA